MQKSIKKVIAGAIAALMITSSMPVVASAAVGDYEPDIQLQFSTFCDDPSDPTSKTAANLKGYQASGLAGYPIQWDQETGTLYAKKADINTYNEFYDSDTVDEDWVLGEGDIFAVTIKLDNVSETAAGNILIRYSDNLVPAGLWQTGSGKKAKFGYASEDDAPSGLTASVGFRSAVTDWSATNLYTDAEGEQVFNTAMDQNEIKADPFAEENDGWSDDMIRVNWVGNGDYVDVSSVSAENGFFNIEDGTFDDEDGYTYDNQFIAATFVFAIAEEGPVQFTLQDPDGTKDTSLDGAAFFAKKSEGLQPEFATTYAPNGENAGSMKMTFMGKNENKGGDEPAHVHNYTSVVTKPTCTTKGYTTYTCQNAGCDNPTYDADYTDALGHTPGEAARENEVPATCSSEGSYDEVVRCTVCKEIISSTPKTIEKIAHTPGEAARENEVPATCSSEGSYDEVVRCTECNEIISSTPKTIAKLAHTPGEAARENEVPATCSSEGSYDEVVRCTECNEIISSTPKTIEKIAHTPAAAVIENEVAPTKKDKGSYDEVVYCSECKAEISREKKYTDALGVTITLGTSDIGAVEGDLKDGANKLAYGQAFTVEAKPVDGATFVGWEIGGNIVSKSATYTGTAASDITITPVFEDAAANQITVTFFDKYGNTVKQYKDMEVADYQAAITADYDTLVGPAYPSYVFSGWDKDKDAILAISESTTVWAVYEKAPEVVRYTVTTNADLELPDGIVNGQIPYDTKVTVSDTAAKAWKVGEAIVAYGTTYEFYVGSDIEVQPVYETVEEVATTTVIGANLVAGSDYKFNIVATRNIPDGFEIVDYGFVYGKNLTDAELDLDKAGTVAASGATIKAVHAGTRNLETNEFALNYGIKAKNAPVTAKSFVTVVKDGNTDIVYSDMFVQNY